MCLDIVNLNESNKKIARLRKIGKPVVAWKVLKNNKLMDDNNPLRKHIDDCDYLALYRIHKYHKGLNRSSRCCTELTVTETHGGLINEGFHCFLTRKEARHERKSWDSLYPEVVKVTIDPKDLVGYGLFFYIPCLVCTKFTI